VSACTTEATVAQTGIPLPFSQLRATPCRRPRISCAAASAAPRQRVTAILMAPGPAFGSATRRIARSLSVAGLLLSLREQPRRKPLMGVVLVVRTSSERAAAPSLCSSWGSGSRPSGSRDHLGLCDPHNPGAMSFVTPASEPRPRGHLRPVRTRVGAIAVIPARGEKETQPPLGVASCFARITGSAGSSSGPRPLSSPARLTRCRRAEVARRAFGCRRSSGLAQSPTGTVVRRVGHERDGSLARRSPGRRRLPHCLSIRWSGRRELDR